MLAESEVDTNAGLGFVVGQERLAGSSCREARCADALVGIAFARPISRLSRLGSFGRSRAVVVRPVVCRVTRRLDAPLCTEIATFEIAPPPEALNGSGEDDDGGEGAVPCPGCVSETRRSALDLLILLRMLFP